jgi:hypothetical protein
MQTNKVITISSELEAQVSEIQSLKTTVEEYQVPNPDVHMPNDPKTITKYRVIVKVNFKYGTSDYTMVDFDVEGDAAAEWCDIIKDEWRGKLQYAS